MSGLKGENVSLEEEIRRIQAVKVECSAETQQDPEKIKNVYDSIEKRFLEYGLNVDAVDAQSLYFSTISNGGVFEGREDEGEPKEGDRSCVEPLHYRKFVPTPLPSRSVRLCVAFMNDQRLAEAVQRAAHDIFAQGLTSQHLHHRSRPSHYHVTIFMTSQPHVLRPDPFRYSDDAAWIGPSDDTLDREIQTMKDIVGTVSSPIILEIYKILLADSGTLLLCLLDISRDSPIYRVRNRFRESFPGAPPKQSTIYHISLGRIVTPLQLCRKQRGRIHNLCSHWSNILKGRRCVVNELHHVIEEQFTTVDGHRTSLPMSA